LFNLFRSETMHRDHRTSSAWGRHIALIGIAAAGLVSIVGSGGGGGYTELLCSTYPDACAPSAPTVAVSPARATVQVGSALTFTAQTTGMIDPTYQWQRASSAGNANSAAFVNVAGATAATYTLVGANLSDDATVFRVVAVPRAGGTSAEGTSRLVVSAVPAVVFQDGDFADATWQVSEISKPANNGATHREERSAGGGSTGGTGSSASNAYRRMEHSFPPTQQSLGVLNLSTTASYDPAQSGAIHVIDYAEDCALLSAASPLYTVASSLLLEQAGRRYRPALVSSGRCGSAAWTTLREAASLAASDFELLDGPSCASGQRCPDFSASAPPIRFGFTRFAAASTTPTVHGIDNWKVTVWRR
jgi:hypothetical protein